MSLAGGAMLELPREAIKDSLKAFGQCEKGLPLLPMSLAAGVMAEY